MPKVISSDEEKWRRENDARTLAEAELIKKDPKRLKGAAVAAKQMAVEHQTNAQNYKTIANKGTTKPNTARKVQQARVGRSKK